MDEPGFGARFVADNPGVRFLKAFVIDVNGIARRKWISCSFEEVYPPGVRRRSPNFVINPRFCFIRAIAGHLLSTQ
jgi:hypothetical protein